MSMYLGLVCPCVKVSMGVVLAIRVRSVAHWGQRGDSVHWFRTCAHYPLAVIADSDTLASLLKFEVLQ